MSSRAQLAQSRRYAGSLSHDLFDHSTTLRDEILSAPADEVGVASESESEHEDEAEKDGYVQAIGK